MIFPLLLTERPFSFLRFLLCAGLFFFWPFLNSFLLSAVAARTKANKRAT